MSKHPKRHSPGCATSISRSAPAAGAALAHVAANVASVGIAALQAMIRETVVLRSQRIYAAEHFQPSLAHAPLPEQLVVVSQSLKARHQPAGKMSMLISLDQALGLAALIAGWNGRPATALNRIDVDAIKELANILLGRCLDAVSEAIVLKPEPGLPTLVQGALGMVATSLRPCPNAICVETTLSVVAREMELTLVAALGTSILRQKPRTVGTNFSA
jgi:chemotaxis protein CheY-P-specific phosphatase CheC